MTNYEMLKNMSIDELVEWIDKYASFDDTPHWSFWDKNYCNKCESITLIGDDEYKKEYAYCELNDNCRFFKEMKETPSHKQIIKMWLESKTDNE